MSGPGPAGEGAPVRTDGGRPALLGRYRLGPQLGVGAMGVVYEADDLLLERSVAVKLLRSAHLRDPVALRRFEREAKATARLEHGNVVGLFDVGVHEGMPFLVMERVRGATLRSALDRRGHLGPDEVVRVGVQVCDALEAAHAQGVIHRDLKPGNIMVTDEGLVKVMDFGLARASFDQRLTSQSTALGTAKYIAPEHAVRAGLDERSDLYSLGVCLYELLTGQAPFDSLDQVSVVYAHVHDEPVPPRGLDPSIPPALEAVVLRAMAKDPDARHQDAAELRTDLLRAAGDDGRDAQAVPVAAPATTAALPADRPGRRRWPWVAATAPPGDGPRRRRWPWVAAAVLAAEVALVLAFPRLTNWSGTPVPDVRGRPLGTAVAELRARGFTRLQLPPDFAAQQELSVIGQEPEPGSRVRLDEATITLTVADGGDGVPTVQGMSPEEAAVLIRRTRPDVQVRYVVDQVPGASPGRVLGTVPAPGTRLPPGGEVQVLVAGPGPSAPAARDDRGAADAPLATSTTQTTRATRTPAAAGGTGTTTTAAPTTTAPTPDDASASPPTTDPEETTTSSTRPGRGNGRGMR